MTTTAITLKAPTIFPAGTAVSAYPVTNWPAVPAQPTGAPVGSAAGNSPVTAATDGSLAFTGLTAGLRYWAVGQVGGIYRYVRFVVGDQADLDPGLPASEGELATHVALTTTAHGGLIASSALDTDATLAANSDAKVPSQKAAKGYSDTTKLAKASNLSDLANAATARTNLAGNLSGTLAARPAAAAGNASSFYFATDDNGGTLYRSDGSAWTRISSGQQSLGYVERTSGDLTGTTAAGFDLTGMTITFTTDGRPYEVWFKGNAKCTGVSTEPAILLLDGGGVQRDEAFGFANTANQTFCFFGRRVFNNPAASYTYKLQGAIILGNGTQTLTVYATNEGTPLMLGANYR